jgi:hypothetical protein
MSFDEVDYYLMCVDIENYLGYLRANELATEYVEKVTASYDDHGDLAELYRPYSVDLLDWKSPCPESKFAIGAGGEAGAPTHVIVSMPFDATEDEKQKVKSEILANLDTAYENGIGWADGIARYLMDTSIQFTKVDTAAMANAVLDISKDVVSELELGAQHEWSGIGKMLERWRGAAATDFYEFHANYSSTLTKFALMSAHVAAGYAAGCALIHGTQEGAFKFVESVRQALDDLLQIWTFTGLKKPEPSSLEVDIPKILAIATDVWTLVRLIPPVKAATEGANVVIDATKALTSLVGNIAGESSSPDVHIEPYQFKDWSANSMYTVITDKMYKDIYLEYDKAMDNLHNGSAPADVEDADNVEFRGKDIEDMMLELQGDRDEWELPAVPAQNLDGENGGYGY